jgi:hypothetical protein
MSKYACKKLAINIEEDLILQIKCMDKARCISL